MPGSNPITLLCEKASTLQARYMIVQLDVVDQFTCAELSTVKQENFANLRVTHFRDRKISESRGPQLSNGGFGLTIGPLLSE